MEENDHSDEEVDSDDLETDDIQVSNKAQGISSKAKKHRQEVDTNVFQLTMKCLRDQAELASGDPIYCSNCQALFNRFSIIEENKEDEQQYWNCEFCQNANKVSIEQGEIPKTNIINYMIEAPA